MINIFGLWLYHLKIAGEYMKFRGEIAKRIGLSAALMMGAAACSDKEPETTQRTEATTEWHEARYASMNGELVAAQQALTVGEEQYVQYLQALPDNCRSAIQPFIPPAGELWKEVSDEMAVHITAPNCHPDNLYAVPELRGQYDQLLILQGSITHLT